MQITDPLTTQSSSHYLVNNCTLLRYSLSTKQLDYELEISVAIVDEGAALKTLSKKLYLNPLHSHFENAKKRPSFC